MTTDYWFRARLPVPPGKDDVYKIGHRKHGPAYIYLSHEARTWKEVAAVDMRVQGFTKLPAGEFYYIINTHTYSLHDLDAPHFLLFDALKVVLGRDDSEFDESHHWRYRERDPEKKRLDVNVHIIPKNTLRASQEVA